MHNEYMLVKVSRGHMSAHLLHFLLLVYINADVTFGQIWFSMATQLTTKSFLKSFCPLLLSKHSYVLSTCECVDV